MPCYHPLHAWRAPGGISFRRESSFGLRIQLPCGQCIGCRLAKSKDWQIRIVHEASLHPVNSFLTLTYDDQHLPDKRTLVKEDFQKFIRALRKHTRRKIRYFMCGEYGSRCEDHQKKNCPECGSIQRPHYHAILFGFDFEDKYHWRTSDRGDRIYRSALLEYHWYQGNSDIGSVTERSAGYVARYSLKKLGGEMAAEKYGDREHPYVAMSLKPGIGANWYAQNETDIFPHDFAVDSKGRKNPVPKYYRRLLEKQNPALAEKLRRERVKKAKGSADNEPERLAVREFIQTKKSERLKRQL